MVIEGIVGFAVFIALTMGYAIASELCDELNKTLTRDILIASFIAFYLAAGFAIFSQMCIFLGHVTLGLFA